jgi:hypothetical protein
VSRVLAQVTTRVIERAPSNPAFERAAWALAVAVVGLILREVWQAWRTRRDRRTRDKAVLSALLREVSIVRGAALAILADLARELALVQSEARWRLKPLIAVPSTVYDTVKVDPPASLLKQSMALADLVRLQYQCDYTNALAAEQQKWKTPSARGQPDQIETILSFHPAIRESVAAVIERCERLRNAIRAAGEQVGGLNLEGPPPANSPEAPAPASPEPKPPTPS